MEEKKQRSYAKESTKTDPIGIRFDKEQLEFIQKREIKLTTKQKVVDYLLNKYWWEQKTNLEPNHKGLPPISVQDSNKPTNALEPQISPQTNFVAHVPPKRKTAEEWVQEKREIEDWDTETYKKWFSELSSCTYLTEKQKSLIKQA